MVQTARGGRGDSRPTRQTGPCQQKPSLYPTVGVPFALTSINFGATEKVQMIFARGTEDREHAQIANGFVSTGMNLLQLGFLVSAITVTIVLELLLARSTVLFVTTMALIVISAVVTLLVKNTSSGWLITVPLLDIAISVLVRVTAGTGVPTAAILLFFPLFWLVLSFRKPGFISATVAVLVAATASALVIGSPDTVVEWLNIVLFPVLTIPLLVVASLASAGYRASQRDLERERSSHNEDQRIFESVTETIGAGIAKISKNGERLALNERGRIFAERAVFTSPGHTDPWAVLYEDRSTPAALGEQDILESLLAGVPDGSIFWVGPPEGQLAASVTIRDLPDDSGVLVVAHDVTRLMNSLQSQQRMLRTVGHELRTPLTSMIGYAELMSDSSAEEVPREWLQSIQDKGHQLSRSIDNLLDAGAEEFALNRVSTHLIELVADIVASHRVAHPNATIHFTQLLAGETHAEIDAARFTRVLEEVLSNAIKFTPGPGSITVNVEFENNHVAVHVRDTGVGMNTGELLQVAEPFYRGEYALRKEVPGQGLGLTLARRIVEAHGGELSLFAEPTGGTRATVRVPRQSAEATTLVA
ncbi:MAG: sensor histidine kinase [Glaciihabitans sp.]|nr:sensor histidine kinase [Glaciihabitans sp.]